MDATQLAVIGGGNMALAILLGAFEDEAIDPLGVIIAEPDEAKRAVFADRGARCVGDASLLADEIDADTQIMLAVKPQVFPTVASELGNVGDRVVISIMAGVKSETIRSAMGGAARVVLPELRALEAALSEHREAKNLADLGLGAMMHARIGRLVFGSADGFGGASASFDQLPDFFQQQFQNMEWIGPAYTAACDPLYARLTEIEQIK